MWLDTHNLEVGDSNCKCLDTKEEVETDDLEHSSTPNWVVNMHLYDFSNSDYWDGPESRILGVSLCLTQLSMYISRQNLSTEVFRLST